MTTVRGGLQSRLQTIEQELETIKKEAILIGNENFNKLYESIEMLFAVVRKEMDETKDALTVTEACVEEMGRDYVRKADLQAYLDDQIKEAVKTILKTTPVEEDDRPEKGLYLTGIGKLREKLVPPPDDPCDVVHTILHRVGSSAYYKKIVPVLPASKTRKDTDQAIIYFTSVYHRKYAAAELRRFFAKERMTSVSVRDLFEKSDVQLAKQMTRLGFQMRLERTICRFRVANIRGVPVLLTAGQDRKYSEMDKRSLQAKLDSIKSPEA